MDSMKDKIVVVSGASKGIGRCVALKMAEEGARVYACSRSEGDFCDDAILYHPLDVTSTQSCQELFDDVMEKEDRYTSQYPLYESPLKNLRTIRETGMEAFLEHERKQWTCGECGGVISVHTGACSGCGKQYGTQIT